MVQLVKGRTWLLAVGVTLGLVAAMAGPAQASTGLEPTSVVAVAGSAAGEVDLTWSVPTDSTGVLGYLIQANTSQGAICEAAECPWVAGQNTSSFTYSGLTNGTSYTFIVYAERAAGFTASAASDPATPFTVPDAPAAPVAERADSGQVTLTWSTPANDGGAEVTSYTVSCVTGGCSAVEGVFSPYTVTGLDPTTEYTFAVVAVNDRGDSASSAPSNAVTPYGAPTAPTEVAATAGNAQVTVTWSASSGSGRELTGYTVVTAASTDTTCTTALGTTTVDGTSASATVTGLTNGTSYVFCVFATSGTGGEVLNSAYSTASTSVSPADSGAVSAPDAPGAPVATAGDASVTLVWTAPSDTGGQDIAAYTAVAVGDATKTCTTVVGVATDPLTCEIDGLTNYTEYTFTVTANNGAFDSDPSGASNAVTPMPAGAGPPSAPTNLQVTFEGTSALVSWDQADVTPPLTRVLVTPLRGDGQTMTPQAPTDFDPTSTSGSFFVGDLAGGDYFGFTVSVQNNLGSAEATSASYRYLSSDLPDLSAWPQCTTATEVECIADAEFIATGAPLSGAGLTTWVGTLGSYPGGPQSINWAIQGLTGEEGEMRLVVRTGGWRPRYTVARVTGMDLQTTNDPEVGWILTITGTPLHMDWAAGDDPLFTTCSAGYSPAPDCGDDTARANEVGSGWRFDGNTQDLGGAGWDGDRERLTGFFVSVDAQVGPFTNPLALQFYPPSSTPQGWQVTVGNPHLDVNGEPVRGYLRAWLPSAYFIAQGTTPAAALAAGFSVTSTEGGRTELVPATLEAHRGGVRVTVPDFGYSVRTLAVLNAPAPAVPVLVGGEVTGSSASFTFAAESGVDYTYSYYVTGLGCDECGLLETDVPIAATTPITSVTVPGLPSGADIHITVTASRGGVAVDSEELSLATLSPPDQPAAPEVGVRTRTSVSITWTAPSDNGLSITDYLVQYRLVTELDWTPFDDGIGASTSATITGLTTGQSYSFRVSAVNAGGESEFSEGSPSALAAERPSAPVAPTIGARTSGSVAITWVQPEANGATITGQMVQYRLVSATEWSTFNDGFVATGSATVTGLTAGQRYVFRVAATNSQGISDFSSASQSALAAQAPSSPAAPTIGAITSTSIAVSWSAPAANGSSITDYVVQFRLASAQAWTTFNDGSGTGLSATVTGLTSGSTYVFRVAATNGEGTSGFSAASQSAQTADPVPPPTRPTLRAGATSSSSVAFTFTRQTGVTYTAAATVGTTSIPASRVRVTFSGTTGTVTVTGLQPVQTVSVRVTATRGDQSVTSAAATAKTKAAPPSPATRVTLSVNSRKFPAVAWTKSASTGGAAVKYVVTIEDARGRAVATSPSLTTTSWSGTRALAKGVYTATVVASNSAGSAAEAVSSRVTVR